MAAKVTLQHKETGPESWVQTRALLLEGLCPPLGPLCATLSSHRTVNVQASPVTVTPEDRVTHWVSPASGSWPGLKHELCESLLT